MTYKEKIYDGIVTWLESIRWKEDGWGRWPYHAKMVRPYGLQCSGMAVGILNVLGALDNISDKQKEEAVAWIQSTQDPEDGYFKDPLVGEAERVGKHSWEEIWNQMSGVGQALDLLGGRPLYETPKKRFADLSEEDPRDFILSLDWTNPWSRSEVVSRCLNAYVANHLTPDRYAKDPILNRAFEVYENELLDPETGMPTKRGCSEMPRAMAGLFKIMHSHVLVGRPVPYAEKAIDTTLGLQRKDGEFGVGHNMCYSWDAVWVLRELDRQLDASYRHDEIVTSAKRCADALMHIYRKSDGGFAFHGPKCQTRHHSVFLSPKSYAISDTTGTRMCLLCLCYVDDWLSS